ncbi:MAG: UbiD family decarboxylase [Thermoanaerobaculales bacterium]|nr:UbiD family decarboxylase [Thermoanaerobaculales bacterium]
MGDELFSDLRLFIDRLRRDGDLRVVDAPVDPRLELAEIHRRVIAAGGPALLFTRPLGAAIPVVTNLFGTARRARLAFGDRPHRLLRSLVDLVREGLPPTPGRLWSHRELAAAGLRLGVRRVRRGPVLDIVRRDVDLGELPALTSWPEDGGRFITLPLVLTRHPETGVPNLGMYRLQIHDRRTTGMHWQIGKGGGFHFAAAEASGRDLPTTVLLGGAPALVLAAVAPLPENVPELLLASLIVGRRLAECEGPDGRPLVADAEIALAGRVRAGVRRPEGPFGDHYGYYSLRHDYPLLEVDYVARRRDAIFPATVVGKPRQEDFFIGDELQTLLSPLFPLVMPGVRAVWSYGETGYHSLAAAVVHERYRREAMASAFRILGEGQLSLTKFLLVTDRALDLTDIRATLSHILARTRPETDLYVLANLSMDTLDYTGPQVNLGSKGVWLGLGEPVRELPREFKPVIPPAGLGSAVVFCPGCLVVDGPRWTDEPAAAARLSTDPALATWPLVVLVDDARRTAASPMSFLWTTFTRFEPAADIHAAGQRVVRHHVAYTAPVVIDSRVKPPYPKELFCDPETAALVGRRWREYFPDGGVEMGDSDRGHLD